VALFDEDVTHIGRVDRFDAPLAQRVVDGAGDELLRDILENLILEALLDDRRGRLARPEPRNTRALRIVRGDVIDFLVDDVARDLDPDVLPRVVDIDEFCLHENRSW